MQGLDLEGDWDPNSHDAQMSKVYGEFDGGDFDGDLEKPVWDDDIDIDDIAPELSEKSKKKKKKKKNKHEDEEDDGVDLDEMDADAKPVGDDEQWDGTEEMRKKKLDEYMDELYGLEFNDMVSLTFETSSRCSQGGCRLEICQHDSSTLKSMRTPSLSAQSTFSSLRMLS